MTTHPQNVIVVGGLGLIGHGIAEALALAGTRVIVASRSAGSASAAERFPGVPVHALGLIEFVAADATVPSSVEALLDLVHDRHGRIDGVVNCALPAPERQVKVEDQDLGDFCRDISFHIGCFFLVGQIACRKFAAQGGGALVMISSIYGAMAPRFEIYRDTAMTKNPAYVASKAAITALGAYLARYYRERNVRVNCISPGGVFAGQDQRFVARYNAHCSSTGLLMPSDVAGAVVFLLSDAAKCITGQNIRVDDGFSL